MYDISILAGGPSPAAGGPGAWGGDARTTPPSPPAAGDAARSVPMCGRAAGTCSLGGHRAAATAHAHLAAEGTVGGRGSLRRRGNRAFAPTGPRHAPPPVPRSPPALSVAGAGEGAAAERLAVSAGQRR